MSTHGKTGHLAKACRHYSQQQPQQQQKGKGKKGKTGNGSVHNVGEEAVQESNTSNGLQAALLEDERWILNQQPIHECVASSIRVDVSGQRSYTFLPSPRRVTSQDIIEVTAADCMGRHSETSKVNH
eukprot:6474554-Amphidinium_carterae.1